MCTASQEKAQQLTVEFAKALGCKPAYINARLVALGHYLTCTRCGGGGHYSFCQMYGTTCFGCGGSGKKAVTLSAGLLATVKAQINAGELKPYLELLRKRAACSKMVDQLFAIWKNFPTIVADKAAGRTSHMPGPKYMSARHRALNSAASTLYDEMQSLVYRIKHGNWQKETRTCVKLSEAEELAAIARCEEILRLVADLENTITSDGSNAT